MLTRCRKLIPRYLILLILGSIFISGNPGHAEVGRTMFPRICRMTAIGSFGIEPGGSDVIPGSAVGKESPTINNHPSPGRALGIVNVREYGAIGDGIADDTKAIQACVNMVSNSPARIIYFPAGTYRFVKLYCYYESTLNPGFAPSKRQASITFKGDGVTIPYHSRTGGNSSLFYGKIWRCYCNIAAFRGWRRLSSCRIQG